MRLRRHRRSDDADTVLNAGMPRGHLRVTLSNLAASGLQVPGGNLGVVVF